MQHRHIIIRAISGIMTLHLCGTLGLQWCLSLLLPTRARKQTGSVHHTRREWPERRNLPDWYPTPVCLGASPARWSPSLCSHPSTCSTLPCKASCSGLKLSPFPRGPLLCQSKQKSHLALGNSSGCISDLSSLVHLNIRTGRLLPSPLALGRKEEERGQERKL